MKRKLQGEYVTISTVGEEARAFVPSPLPPSPGVEWTAGLREKFDQALLAVGRLDSISVILPETSIFLYTYVRKEAVLSSMIEGTQSSLSDLLRYEFEQHPGVPLDDVQEVSNYVAALNHGLTRLNEGFPLSLRLLKEMHELLLADGRGHERHPGEFRRSQNWIGGSRPGNAVFVPPPPEYVPECMGKLELFLHGQPEQTPVLVKAALAHVQFETIHPFLDGNGRLGRLLIPLQLCSEKVLNEPMLYLSLYFKMHRHRYYELLNHVRVTGDWEAWLEFFADAVIHTAKQAVDTARRLIRLTEDDARRILAMKGSAASANLIHRAMLERPLCSPSWIRERTSLAQATVNSGLRDLQRMGIVEEVTGRKRSRLYVYAEYLRIMSEGTELPA
jgi:Fic family protein